LIAGLGQAATLALVNSNSRRSANVRVRELGIRELKRIEHTIHGDLNRVLPHTLNLSIPGIDSEAAMLALKGIAALSNGSACTSHNYSTSQTLLAMGLDGPALRGALRFSWCHLTPPVPWHDIVDVLDSLR
jgi:cysteine desulfurase